MIDKIKSALLQVVTEHDNKTHDVFKWLALIAVLLGLTIQGYAVFVLGQPFSMIDFGTGIGALFTGAGVALGLKKETEV